MILIKITFACKITKEGYVNINVGRKKKSRRYIKGQNRKYDKQDPLSMISHGLPNENMRNCCFGTNFGLEQNHGELLTKIYPNKPI